MGRRRRSATRVTWHKKGTLESHRAGERTCSYATRAYDCDAGASLTTARSDSTSWKGWKTRPVTCSSAARQTQGCARRPRGARARDVVAETLGRAVAARLQLALIICRRCRLGLQAFSKSSRGRAPNASEGPTLRRWRARTIRNKHGTTHLNYVPAKAGAGPARPAREPVRHVPTARAGAGRESQPCNKDSIESMLRGAVRNVGAAEQNSDVCSRGMECERALRGSSPCSMVKPSVSCTVRVRTRGVAGGRADYCKKARRAPDTRQTRAILLLSGYRCAGSRPGHKRPQTHLPCLPACHSAKVPKYSMMGPSVARGSLKA